MGQGGWPWLAVGHRYTPEEDLSRAMLHSCRWETGLSSCGNTAHETTSKSSGPTGFLFSLPFLGLSPLPPIPLGLVRVQRETC